MKLACKGKNFCERDKCQRAIRRASVNTVCRLQASASVSVVAIRRRDHPHAYGNLIIFVLHNCCLSSEQSNARLMCHLKSYLRRLSRGLADLTAYMSVAASGMLVAGVIVLLAIVIVYCVAVHSL